MAFTSLYICSLYYVLLFFYIHIKLVCVRAMPWNENFFSLFKRSKNCESSSGGAKKCEEKNESLSSIVLTKERITWMWFFAVAKGSLWFQVKKKTLESTQLQKICQGMILMHNFSNIFSLRLDDSLNFYKLC